MTRDAALLAIAAMNPPGVPWADYVPYWFREEPDGTGNWYGTQDNPYRVGWIDATHGTYIAGAGRTWEDALGAMATRIKTLENLKRIEHGQ